MSSEFSELLLDLGGAGLPFVGPSGLQVPQVKLGCRNAPVIVDVERDWVEVRKLTDFDAQPEYLKLTLRTNGVVESNRDQVLAACDAWERKLQRRPRVTVKPKSRPALCLLAAHGWHLGTTDPTSIERPEPKPRDQDAVAARVGLRLDTGLNRVKALPEVIAKGDDMWTALGAWPWAAFGGDPPETWWQHPDALRSIVDAVALHEQELRRQLRWVGGALNRLCGQRDTSP